ncbi:MAG: site-specific integrase [Bacteroidales bacterium]|nr:site-specific integrase [Bacteroidales bacterium]
MKRKTFNVLFFIKKNQLLKNGEAPVRLRVTVDSRFVEISVKRSCPPNLWNQSKEVSRGKDRTATELNRYLELIRSKIHQIYRELETSGKTITAEVIRNLYYGVDEESRTLLEVFKEHNAHIKTLIGKDFAPKTISRYETTEKYLTEFIKKDYNVSDISLNDLQPRFMPQFDAFLKTEKGCSHNSSITRLKNLKKIINLALENGWIDKNPFAFYRFKQETVDPVFLTMEEIKAIYSKEITINRIDQVRDIFIFCCMTGLAFSDVKTLTSEHIVKDDSGNYWIRKKRQKTKNMCSIPLLPVPQQILNKYKETPNKNGELLPVLSNQKMNGYLKEIADLCGIKKILTTHVARHSYATSVCLANGVSMENVAKMLGHSDTKMTQHYAHVLDSSILRDMKAVETALKKIG